MVFVPASRVILMRQNGTSVQAGEGIEYPSGTPTPTPAPTITSLALTGSTGKAGDWLNAGDTVRATATFSSAVNVTGEPRAVLIVGSTARNASYLSGSGTSSLVFAYTIQAGEADSDGIAIPADALSLNGGTIKSSGGVDAVLSSAAVSANSSYLVDTSAPSAPIINTVAGNDVINASEATSVITGTSEANATIALTLGSGNVRTVTANGSGVWSYTLVTADITAMGQGSETISATATDAAGNTSSATTRAITVDTVAPSVSSVSLSGSGAQNDFLSIGDTVTATVTFDSVVTVTGTPQMALNIGGTTRQANYLSGSGSNTVLLRYSIQSGDTDANGISIAANSLSLNSGTIVDSAGNSATLSHGALTDQSSWKVDTTAPTTPTVALGAGVSDGATHEEATAGTGVITVSAETGSTIAAVFTRGGNTVTKTATGTGSALAIVLTSGDLETLGDGTINVSFTATDAAGNVSTAATTSFTLLEPEPEPAGKLIVEPDEANSRFAATNSAEFPSATWQWYNDRVEAISGATTIYLAYSLVPEGMGVFLRANGDPLTDSAEFIIPRNTTIKYFNAADEASGGLNGRDGFTASSAVVFASDQLQDTGTDGGNKGFQVNVGTTKQRIQAKVLIGDPAYRGDTASSSRAFIIGKTDNNNQIFVRVTGDWINVYGVSGGSWNWGFKFIGDPKTEDGDWIGIELENGTGGNVYLRIDNNGTRIDGGGPEGVNVTSALPGFTIGPIIGFEGPEGTGLANPSYPIPLMTEFKASEIVAGSIIVYLVDFPAPAGVGENVATITGNSTATDFQVAFFDAEGLALSDFIDIELSSAGAFVETVPVPASLGGLTNVYMRARVTADVDDYTDTQITYVPAHHPFFATRWGLQPGNVAGWSGEDIYTDRGLLNYFGVWVGTHWWGDWTWDGEVMPYKDNGTQDVMAVPGAQFAMAKIWEGGYIGYQRGGQYLVTWEMENVTASWANLENATAGAVNNTAKTALVTINDNASVGAHLRFDWSSTPTGDWKVSAIRVGETSTGPLNDKVIQAFQDNDFYRWMKAQQTEHPYLPTSDGLSLITPIMGTPEIIADASNQANIDVMLVLPTNENDVWTTDFAQRMKARLLAGISITIELGNELFWNPPYAPATNTLITRMLNAGGYLAGAPAGGWITDDDPTNPYTVDREEPSSTLVRPVPAGTKILIGAGNYQNAPMLAKVDLPIGHGIPNIAPASFYEDEYMIIYGKYQDMFVATRKFQCFRTLQIAAIFEEVFEGTNPIKTGIGIQQGETNESIMSWLTPGGVGKGISFILPSHYTESNIKWADAPSWVRNPADQATWLANYHAQYAVAKLPNVITNLSNHRTLYSELLRIGWTHEEAPVVKTYEGELHCYIEHVPTEYRVQVQANMIAYKSSDDYYDFITDMMTEIHALGIYGACDFAMHGRPNPNETIDNFGYIRGVNTYNDPSTGSQDKKWHARSAFLAARAV
jgi:hypothetical protein